MTDKQIIVVGLIEAMAVQVRLTDISAEDIAQANKIADLILQGESDGKVSDGHDSEANDDSDSEDTDSSPEVKDADSDSDESEEAHDDEASDGEQEPEPEEKPKKKRKAPAKKSFKPKPQVYDRENDTHKEIFSGLLKSLSPNWKKDSKLKIQAKNASVKLEGEEFLDHEGEVLEAFKGSVREFLGAKK